MEGFVARDLLQTRRHVTLDVFVVTGITELTHTLNCAWHCRIPKLRFAVVLLSGRRNAKA
jgi:hypothetical protein